jgi:UDPglucose 6-dehydrogenase
MTQPTIGFAGMTHLGIVSGAAATARGFSVVCYDPDATRIQALSEGRLPVFEPGLDDTVRANRARFTFTNDVKDLDRCDVVYVAPDVATNDFGESDLSGITALIAEVMARARPFTVVVLSQVPPGFTRRLSPGDHPLQYQVETLVFGNALERAIRPERFIVGCSDPSLGLPVEYERFLKAFDCPLLQMRYESAELAKIAINCCLVAMVSTANTLAEICEGIGADWTEIVPALKLDRRIGPYSYLQAGLGIAGGNLERDLATVRQFAIREGTDAGVVEAWIANSSHRKEWPIRTLQRAVLAQNPSARIGLLGLAYKQDTHSTKNSPAVALIDALGPAAIAAYDPIVPSNAVARPNLTRVADALAAADDADAVAVMTPWPEFRDLIPRELASRMKGRILLDPYRLIDPALCKDAGLVHYRLGVAASSKHDV